MKTIKLAAILATNGIAAEAPLEMASKKFVSVLVGKVIITDKYDL